MVTVCRFLPFLAVLQVQRINNLNVVNTQDGFEPRPAHHDSKALQLGRIACSALYLPERCD
jgi:hypothetical protein